MYCHIGSYVVINIIVVSTAHASNLIILKCEEEAGICNSIILSAYVLVSENKINKRTEFPISVL
jgi:hypothetical protein